MKKLFYTLALLLLGLSTLRAQDERPSYSLWPSNQEGTTENINVECTWESGITREEITEDSDHPQYYKITSNGTSDWPCFSLSDSDFDYGKIFYNSYDLVFDIRTSDDFNTFNKFEIQTVADKENPYDFVHNGEWQTVRLNLNDFKDKIASYPGNEHKRVFLFYIIFKNKEGGIVPDGVSFDVTNIRLEPNNDTPIPNPNETPDNPNPSEGAVFSGSESFSFIQGENVFPYTLSYTITYLENKTLNIKASIEWGDNGVPSGAEDFMYVSVDGGELPGTINRINGETKTQTSYDAGREITIGFKIPAESGGAITPSILYVVGSSNQEDEGRVSIKLSANIVDGSITMNSAKVSYEYTSSKEIEDLEVIVYCDGNPVNSNPVEFIDLLSNTEYSHTFIAKATVEDEEISSNEVVIIFKTLRDPSQKVHNYQIINGFLNKAKLEGEDDSQRRSLPVSIKSDVVYNPDNTLTVYFSFFGIDKVLNFVPQVNIADEWSVKDGLMFYDDGSYSCTSTKTFEPGTEVLVFFYPEFNGGVERLELKKFIVDEGNEPIDYGDPVDMIIYTDKTELKVEEPQWYCAYLVDANGNFILDEEIEIDIEDDSADADLTGDFITLMKKGSATLTATYNGITAKQIFTVPYSRNAVNLASGVKPTNCGHIQDVSNATDGNESSIMTLLCEETQEHEFTLDLGKGEDKLFNIEYVNLVWEGASATEYSVIFYNIEGDEEIIVGQYDIKDGEGGAGLTIRKNINVDNYKVRYVKVITNKAFDKSWNIKLYEILVFGTEYIPVDWSDLTADDNNHSTPSDWVVPIYSTHYGVTDLLTLEAENGKVSHLPVKSPSSRNIKAYAADDEDDDNTSDMEYKVLLFEDMHIDENASIPLDIDVTNATQFNISINSPTVGTIKLSALWEYQGISSNTNDKVYRIEIGENQINTWYQVSFPATDIGYGVSPNYKDYGPITTIAELYITSDIPEFAIDNCYFAGNSSLAVETVETAEGEAVYFNLQGVKIANPDHGIFIKVQNGKATKIVR